MRFGLRGEIPAYAGMTWEGAGMMWEGARLCSPQCVHVGHIAVAETREGARLCSPQCRNNRMRVPRARGRARIRVRAHTSFCRVLSDSVGFCRILPRASGVLVIVD